MKEEIKRNVFLDNLPHKGKTNQLIDWKNSVGCKVHFIYDDIEDYLEIVDYIYINKKSPKLKIQYRNKSSYIEVNNFKRCHLGEILKKKTLEFKLEIEQTLKDDKRDLTIISREKRPRYSKNGSFKCYEKYYEYHCNKCSSELWIIESALLNQKQGCSCCCNRTIIKGVNDIATTNPELVKYFVDVDDTHTYSYGSNAKVLLKCPDCGFHKEMKIGDLYSQGFSCHRCGDGISYPNKFMCSLLSQLKGQKQIIDFKTEYSPSWIKPKRYDFYFKISNKKYIVEMDGGLGHGNRNYGKSSEKIIEQSKELDNYKDELANEHNIEVIRINSDYYKAVNRFEHIKNNVIHSKLNELFNLSKVDWTKCEEFGCKNLMKLVCDYWNKDNDISYVEKETNLGRNTITRYLKSGTKLGICFYNSKLYHDYCSKIVSMRYNSNPIVCLENGLVFNSCSDCKNNDEDIFNTSFNAGTLLKYVRDNKPYKGYSFKFISDLTEEEYMKYNIEKKLIQIKNIIKEEYEKKVKAQEKQVS